MFSSVPSEIKSFCESRFGSLKSFRPASGGCINNGGTLTVSDGAYFLKWNDARKFPHMFEAEAKGLRLLTSSKSLAIPKVIDVYEGDTYACLILENIHGGLRKKSFWEELGHGLAVLHKTTQSEYGLDHNNYMGSLPQPNKASSDWISFFIESRLNPQIEIAKNAGKLGGRDLKDFDLLKARLPEFLTEEAPALVHGDLWSGNFLVGREGEPVLIDPAVAYSHREVDLAMTTLFGGFDRAFYDAYFEAWPLPKGYQQRFDIYNLYPLMVHVNLFGGGYYNQVKNILSNFTS